jgi:hypothetical protein
MGLPFTPNPLRLGELSGDPSELVAADVAVIFTCGGMYWVFRLLLGINSSSSDHSASASPNGFGCGFGWSIIGETVLAGDGGSS